RARPAGDVNEVGVESVFAEDSRLFRDPEHRLCAADRGIAHGQRRRSLLLGRGEAGGGEKRGEHRHEAEKFCHQLFFQLPGIRAWRMGMPSVCSIWRVKRYLFSTSGHGHGGTSPLPGSTRAQMKVCSRRAIASAKRFLKSSTVSAPKAF